MFGSFARQLATRRRKVQSNRRRVNLEVTQLDARIVPVVSLASGLTGLNNTGWYPPDPQVAAGPSHVVETVNESMAIYSKSTGTLLSSEALTTLFSGLDTNGGPFDPSVFYDESAGRFVIEAAVKDSTNSKSFVDFAFSKTSDPTQGFYTTQIEVDQGGVDWSDNGKIGWNNDAYVYTGNLYTWGGSYSQEVIVSIDKTTVTGSVKSYVTTQGGDFAMIPARMHNSTAGGPMWFVESSWNGGSTLYVTRMDNVLSSNPTFTTTSIGVNTYSQVTPTQPGGTVDAGDCRTETVEWNNGHLVASLNSGAGSDAAAAWYLFSTSGSTPTLSQQGVIHPGTGISTYFGAVTVDSSGDMAMTYMESSSTENPSMYVTGRLATDAPNSMEPPVRAQAGAIALNPNRAGDYGGIALDPSAANTYWAINEYAPSGASWGVFISQFTVTSASGTNTAPTITSAASATPSPVTGTTTNLSVQATDSDGDSLTYTWSVSAQPSGSTTPTFSTNGGATSNNTTATFYQAGTYTFQVTVTDSAGLTSSSSVTVTVNQTKTSISVTPASVSLGHNATQQFTATELDQFGKAMATQPSSFTWSLATGSVGTISTTGLYTAPNSDGSATVNASADGLTGSAAVTVSSIPAAPTNLTATAVSAREIDLSWSESSTNATGFYVQRSSNGGKSWTQIANVTPGTATTYADKSVSKGKSYQYRVDAYNGVGTSGWSNTASATTPLRNPSLYPDPDVPDQTKHGLIAKESAGNQSASSDSLSWISATTLSGASASVDSSPQQGPSASEGTLTNAIQVLQERLVDGAANHTSALLGAQAANKHSAIGMLFETLNSSLDAATSELLSL